MSAQIADGALVVWCGVYNVPAPLSAAATLLLLRGRVREVLALDALWQKSDVICKHTHAQEGRRTGLIDRHPASVRSLLLS